MNIFRPINDTETALIHKAWVSCALIGAVTAVNSCSRETEPAAAVQNPETVEHVIQTRQPAALRNVEVVYQGDPQPAETEFPSLWDVISPDSDVPYDHRIFTLQEEFTKQGPLPDDMESKMLDLISNPGEPVNLTAAQRRGLKNDVLNLLQLRLTDHSRLRMALNDLQQNEAADPVMRDYALQFLASMDAEFSQGFHSHWRTIDSVLQTDSPSASDSNRAATALLHVLSAQRKEGLDMLEQSRLESAALRMAGGEDYPEAARVTAMQVCAELKVSGAENLANRLARSHQVGFSLRISAIAALGSLTNDDETIAYLQELTTGRNLRLRVPAQSALERIRKVQNITLQKFITD